MVAVRSHPLGARRCLAMQSKDRLPGRKVLYLHIDPSDPCRPTRPERLEDGFLDGKTSSKILNPISTGLFQLSRMVDPPEEALPVALDASGDAGNVDQIDSDTDDHDYL